MAIIVLAMMSLQGNFAANATIDNSTSGGITQGITDTGNGDTLHLQPGTYDKIGQDSNVFINKNITIIGNGSSEKIIIDGKSIDGRIFTINNGLEVTFINISFHNGFSTLNGGGIYANSGTVTIINCTFVNCAAVGYSLGGAIYNNYNLTVINSTFINNHADVSGGGIASNAALFVDNCIFINNTADNHGGGIDIQGDNAKINNSKFINNTAPGGGGGLWSFKENLTISNCYFDNNSASVGGAIMSSGANLKVKNCIFENNNARLSGFGAGGAISNYGINGFIYNCSFRNNSATWYGGAAYLVENNEVRNCIFKSNLAGRNGGAITNNERNGPIQIYDCEFIDNIADSALIVDDYAYGGAVYIVAANSKIINSNFTNNTVKGDGANAFGGALVLYGTNILVNSCIFKNNNGSYQAGAIELISDNIKLINSIFEYNYAERGGAIRIRDSINNIIISNCNFIGNNATFVDGGAIYNNGVNITVLNSIFVNNSANFYGGAIFNLGYNFWITDSTFINNAGTYGGGVFNSNFGNIIINSSNFTNNTQAIGLGNTNYQLNNNIIKNNTIAIQFILYNTVYNIPDLIGTGNNIIANNTYVIGISGRNTTYALANSNYNTSGNRNGVIFTGIGQGSTNSGIANGNKLVNSTIRGYSGVGITFDRSSENNNVSDCNFSNNNIGVLFNGANNNLWSSNIVNNVQGINVSNNASNSVINYNRILNNTNAIGSGLANYGNSTNANFNWWGQNNIANFYSNTGSLNLTYWYVLQLSLNITINNTANTTRQYSKNQLATLSYRLGLNNNWTLDIPNNPSFLPHFTVILYLNNSTLVIFSSNYQDARFYYYSNNVIMLTNTDPSAQIRVLSDNEDIYLRLNEKIETMNVTVKIGTNSTIIASNGTLGKTINIKGVAKDVNGNVLTNTKLTVSVGGKTYTVTTNNMGMWNLSYKSLSAGIFKVSVKWNGNNTHNAFINSTNFTVKENRIILPKAKKNTTLTLEVDGDKITATLVDKEGNLLANKKIVFRIKGDINVVGITNKEGEAIIYYKDAYKYKIKAKFRGDSDYYPSSDEYIPKSISKYISDGSGRIIGTVTMKKTGIPIIVILLVLMASISLLGYRKRK